jgi:hypothetical protein
MPVGNNKWSIPKLAEPLIAMWSDHIIIFTAAEDS